VKEAPAMKLYTFRCSSKADLYGVSEQPAGDNLPSDICSGGWIALDEATVRAGDRVDGFVTRDLYRDLERRGFHLAVGLVNGPVSPRDLEVANALAAANKVTGFFRTD
jgi:hypothetical protein